MHAPMQSYFQDVKHILCYVNGILSNGLKFTPGSLQIRGYSDADWVGDPHDRRSISGYCVFLGNIPVIWSAKKQDTVAPCSTEAEYRVLAQVAAEISWLQMLLSDFHITTAIPHVWCDNLSSIALTSNLVFHARTKHIKVDYHYIREQVMAKKLHVHHISSID